jgi:hypothetical protein
MAATHVSLICPACSQSFLSLQGTVLSMQACPHCAFTAAQTHFTGTTLPGQAPGHSPQEAKRELRKFTPSASQLPHGKPTAPMASAVPTLRESPMGSHLSQKAPDAALPSPLPFDLNSDDSWLAGLGAAPSKATETSAVPLPRSGNVPGGSGDWSPLQAAGDRAFHFGPTEHDMLFTKAFELAQPRSMTWIWVVLSIAAAVCVGLLITKPDLFDMQSHAPSSAAVTPTKPAQSSVPPITASMASYPEPPESKLTMNVAQAQVQTLINALSEAKTLDDRLLCIASADDNRAAVSEFFALRQNELKVEAFRPLPLPAKLLPGGHSTLLFEARTNSAGVGTSLIRLTGPSMDSLLLDWNLLQDSHTGALTAFIKNSSARPRWITLGLKRNFGFDEPKTVRDACHAFDVQGQADGSDRIIALCPKDSAFGRAIDRIVSWDELYLVRLLISWTPVEGKQRLTLIDAEHMPGTL